MKLLICSDLLENPSAATLSYIHTIMQYTSLMCDPWRTRLYQLRRTNMGVVTFGVDLVHFPWGMYITINNLSLCPLFSILITLDLCPHCSSSRVCNLLIILCRFCPLILHILFKNQTFPSLHHLIIIPSLTHFLVLFRVSVMGMIFASSC